MYSGNIIICAVSILVLSFNIGRSRLLVGWGVVHFSSVVDWGSVVSFSSVVDWGGMISFSSMVDWGSMVSRSSMVDWGGVVSRSSMVDWCNLVSRGGVVGRGMSYGMAVSRRMSMLN